MPGYDVWPTQRVIVHDGFRSQTFATSGSYYYSTFITPTDHPASRGLTPGPARAVFVLDRARNLLDIASALVLSGHGAIVTDKALVEDSATLTIDVDAGAGVKVHVRTGELTYGVPPAEVVRDPAKLEARALALATSTAALTKPAAHRTELPPMRVRDYNK